MYCTVFSISGLPRAEKLNFECIFSANFISELCEFLSFLPARRYVSAGTSYSPVSVSVRSRCSIETVELIRLVFGVHSVGGGGATGARTDYFINVR